MGWENEAAAVRMGLRVLIRCPDQRRSHLWLREMAEIQDMRPRPNQNMIDCEGGGLAHFVWDSEQVRGCEYHAALGPMFEVLGLTPEMQSRVRLAAAESR